MASNTIGVIFALSTMLAWGLGDFFIQKVSRKVGIWKALFYIGLLAAVGLLPFVWREIPVVLSDGRALLLLLLAALAMTVASLFDFEALKEGKLSIMEPLLAAELPITVLLGVVLGHERLTPSAWILMGTIFIGIVIAVTEHHTTLHYHKRMFEKGVIFAAMAAVGMALVNLMMGLSSQGISPLFTVWFVHGLLGLVCFIYLAFHGQAGELIKDFRGFKWPIIAVSVVDNIAWITYGAATTKLPIALAITIAESYIIISILLGIFENHERLRRHQVVGVVLAALAVIVLSAISG